MGTLIDYYTNINYPGHINKDLNGARYNNYLNLEYYQKIFTPIKTHTPNSSIHSSSYIEHMVSDYESNKSVSPPSSSYSIYSNNSNRSNKSAPKVYLATENNRVI